MSEAWVAWLSAAAAARDLPDLDALAKASGIALDALQSWDQQRPPIDQVLQFASFLQVDAYQVLIAAGWVTDEVGQPEAPRVQTDGSSTTIRGEQSQPPEVS